MTRYVICNCLLSIDEIYVFASIQTLIHIHPKSSRKMSRPPLPCCKVVRHCTSGDQEEKQEVECLFSSTDIPLGPLEDPWKMFKRKGVGLTLRQVMEGPNKESGRVSTEKYMGK